MLVLVVGVVRAVVLSVIKDDLWCIISSFSSRWSCCVSSTLALSLRREISFCSAVIMDLVICRRDGVVLVISFLNNSPSSLELSNPFLSSAISLPLSDSSTNPCSLPSISAFFSVVIIISVIIITSVSLGGRLICIIYDSRRRRMIQSRECPVTQSSQASWPFEYGSCLGNWLGMPASCASSRASVVWARACCMILLTYRRLLSAFRPHWRSPRLHSI